MGKNIWDAPTIKKRDDCFQALSLTSLSFTYLCDTAVIAGTNGNLFQWQAPQAYAIKKVFIGSNVSTNIGGVGGGCLACGWSFGISDITLAGLGFGVPAQSGVFALLINGGLSGALLDGVVPQNQFYDMEEENIYVNAGQILYFNYGCIATGMVGYLTTTLYLLETHI